MEVNLLKIDLVTKDDIHILKLVGNLDIETTSKLSEVKDALVQNQNMKIILDLQGLTLIDSTGIGAIVGLFKRVRSKSGDVIIAQLHSQPREIFRLLGLTQAFRICSSIEESINQFR
jgi:anti-anti-sigma factor